MSTIRLDVSEIQNLKKRIAKMQRDLEECMNDVSSVLNHIDTDVKNRRDIGTNLLQAKNDLYRQKEFLSQCEAIIGESVNDFVDAEKIDHLPATGVFSGSSGNSGNTGGFFDFLTDKNLLDIAKTVALFSSPGLFLSISEISEISDYSDLGDYIQSKWSNIKGIRKIASFSKEISSIVDGLGGKTPDWIKDIVGSDFFKGVGYVSDVEKLIKSTVNEDVDGLVDLLGKYGVKQPIKELVMLSGEGSAGASLVADFALQGVKSYGEIAGETITDIYDVFASPESDWKDYAKCVTSLYSMSGKVAVDTAWNVVGSKAQTMTDILDFVGIGNYSQQFEDYTGKKGAGIIDFYESVGSDIASMYNTLGVKDTTKILAESFCETLADQASDLANTVASWGKSAGDAFKNLIQ